MTTLSDLVSNTNLTLFLEPQERLDFRLTEKNIANEIDPSADKALLKDRDDKRLQRIDHIKDIVGGLHKQIAMNTHFGEMSSPATKYYLNNLSKYFNELCSLKMPRLEAKQLVESDWSSRQPGFSSGLR